MKCAQKKLRPPVKWHGGKTYLARRIVDLFPPHEVYLEPFLGGGSILLNKVPCGREIAADMNADLINLWECLQDPLGAVRIIAGELPYDEDTFRGAEHWLASENRGVRAVAFLVRNRFSRGGLGKDFAWSDRLRGGQPGDVNAWKTIVKELPLIAERIRRVEFGCTNALDLIQRINQPGDLVYCDPPYLHETRTAKKAYEFEMSREQHGDLLDLLSAHKGHVFLSGYRSQLYDEALVGWARHEFSMPNHSGQGKTKQRRIECVWENR